MSAGGSYSQSSSTPTVVSPFGNTPFSIVGQTRKQFATPLAQGFGLGDPNSPQYRHFQQQLGRSQGPLASLIQQSTPIANSFIGQQADLSKQLMSGAQSAYGSYQNSLDQFMKQLPGFSQTAGQATGAGQQALGYAQDYAKQAFSPLQSQAMYQQNAQSALAPSREAAAARGMLEGGQAQAGEQGLLANLANQALQGEQANQQAAVSQLGGAGSNLAQLVGSQAGIAGLAPQAAQEGMAGQQQYGQLMQALSQMPLAGAQQLLGFLTGAQAPNMALLSQTLPQVAQKSSSKSMSGQGGLSDRRLKTEIRPDVPGLDAVLELVPVSFEYIQPNALELAPGRRYGVIAQEVADVAPLAIREEDGYLRVDYQQLVPILIQAIRELTARVAALEEAV